MNRKYWLDLFTGKTWEEFLKNGASVSGFRKRRRNIAETIQPGDYLICYLTGISRFVGILEVKSKCYFDETPLWENEVFPYRFKVELVCKLEPKTAIPVLNLKERLSFFLNLKSKNAWTGHFRGSPVEFEKSDGEAIIAAIIETSKNPVERDYDEKKYKRLAKVYELKEGVVTVPEEEEEEEKEKSPFEKISHEEIQWLLLKLG
ncbi:MAG: EVE domain-containing protein [Deltaproteobacteria bacterium]|nr:EVE domain-containing protein [Deltaproteobacteria bacterium]